MVELGDIFDQKYRVDAFCSIDGGMGAILFVTSLIDTPPFPIVLKYCKLPNEENVKRFRREARLMDTFRGNSKIVQIWDQNLDHDPPYIVMKYYQDGDISREMQALQSSIETQEKYFLQMIDCVQELHSRNEFHRDIKPMNFLREGDAIVVSDFGLSTEVGSMTAFTSTTASWGTQGYIPPEFLNGGFKRADASADIYMLGKTFYALLTGRWPAFITSEGISPPIFHVIERCCQLSKEARYQSLADLKQSLVTAYDVLLGRAGGRAQQLLAIIKGRLERSNQYDVEEVADFVEQLSLIGERDQIQMCFELPKAFFGFIGDTTSLSAFLSIYERMVESGEYSWGYAEVIASNMKQVFASATASLRDKAIAIDLAIRAAISRNRFAAMDTCKAIIKDVKDTDLGLHVAGIIIKHNDSFLTGMEPSDCGCDPIRNAIRQIRQPA